MELRRHITMLKLPIYNIGAKPYIALPVLCTYIVEWNTYNI